MWLPIYPPHISYGLRGPAGEVHVMRRPGRPGRWGRTLCGARAKRVAAPIPERLPACPLCRRLAGLPPAPGPTPASQAVDRLVRWQGRTRP